MKFAIFGTGAVGGYIGGLLVQSGHSVSFIARGAHLQAIREKGLILRYIEQGQTTNQTLRVSVTDDPEEVGEVDYIFFGVKAFDTEKAGYQLQPMVGLYTAIITTQNGVDSPDQLSMIYGVDRIMAGAVRVEATLGEPGVIVKYGQPRGGSSFEVAELSGERTTRLGKLVDVLNQAGVKATLSTSPLHVIWSKFLVLAPTAALTAASRAHGGEVFSHEPAKNLYAALVEEMAAVARAEGVEFSPEAVERAKHPLFPLDTAFKSSLQRDFEKGLHTETEELLGAVVRRGSKYNIPTPHFNTLYALLSLSEKVGYRYGL
jgi:2-dehydropantoate 2-reductase